LNKFQAFCALFCAFSSAFGADEIVEDVYNPITYTHLDSNGSLPSIDDLDLDTNITFEANASEGGFVDVNANSDAQTLDYTIAGKHANFHNDVSNLLENHEAFLAEQEANASAENNESENFHFDLKNPLDGYDYEAKYLSNSAPEKAVNSTQNPQFADDPNLHNDINNPLKNYHDDNRTGTLFPASKKPNLQANSLAQIPQNELDENCNVDTNSTDLDFFGKACEIIDTESIMLKPNFNNQFKAIK